MTFYYPQTCAVLRVLWEDFETGDPNLQAPYSMNVLPKRCRVDINSYREADTFELEVDYKNFPFDPRLMRSCQVTIHFENMGILYQQNKFTRIAPKDPSTGDDHNTVFIGFVDDIEIRMDGSSRAVILRGRDYTSIYLDAPWAGEILNLAQPIDVALQGIISKLKATGDIVIDNRTGLSTLPNLGAFAKDLGEYASKRTSRSKESFWDVLTDITDRAGLILYMELDKLVLTIPKVLYSSENATQFIWGHNLKSLSMKRRVGRIKNFNITVRSIIGKEVVTISIPKDAKTLPNKGSDVYLPKLDAKGNPIKGEETVAPFLAFSLSNINDRDHLISYGERIYEEIGRQQLEGELSTKDMDSFAATQNQEVVNLTKLRNGAAIKLEINPQDMEVMRRLSSVEQREEYLVKHKYEKPVARAIATNFARFDTALYVREVRMMFDQDDGWSLDIAWINRIETKEANK